MPAPTIELTKLELAPTRPDFVEGMLILETPGDCGLAFEGGAGSVSSTAMGFNLLTLARDESGLPGSAGVPSMLVPLYGDDDDTLSNYTIHKKYNPVKKTRESVDDSFKMIVIFLTLWRRWIFEYSLSYQCQRSECDDR